MSNYPNLPRTAWIVCVDTYFKGEGMPYTETHRVFLDEEQARQYCEDYASQYDYQWIPGSNLWDSGWRSDGSMQKQYRMYIDSCRLEQPVSKECEA